MNRERAFWPVDLIIGVDAIACECVRCGVLHAFRLSVPKTTLRVYACACVRRVPQTHTKHTLYPLWAAGDGNCLVQSLLQAMWGTHVCRIVLNCKQLHAGLIQVLEDTALLHRIKRCCEHECTNENMWGDILHHARNQVRGASVCTYDLTEVLASKHLFRALTHAIHRLQLHKFIIHARIII